MMAFMNIDGKQCTLCYVCRMDLKLGLAHFKIDGVLKYIENGVQHEVRINKDDEVLGKSLISEFEFKL